MGHHLTRSRVVAVILSALLIANGVIALVSAAEPGNDHFQHTWNRTDQPVKEGEVARTWMWGPEAFTEVLQEPYAESPGGERDVQYFDKSRMEVTHPDGDSDSFWYVTNGLLVVEMVTGRLQLGDDTFEQRKPADIPVAGDADDMTGPTYETFGSLLSSVDDHGQATIMQRVDRLGNVTEDSSLASMGITLAHYDAVTGHNVAAPFWDFMTSTGVIYQDGSFQEGNLFPHPVYATGRPITEPYFATVKVADQERTVLIQCFERRCLTYTADNPEGWQVEAGNVGQHYYAWRYDSKYDLPEDNGEATPTPPGNGNNEATPTGSAEATATTGNGGGGGDIDTGGTATEPGGGGGNPTATATSTSTPTATPIPEPDIDVRITQPSGSISLQLLSNGFNITSQVTNDSTVIESVNVDVSVPSLSALGTTVCSSYSDSKTVQVNPGTSQSVTFNYPNCVLSILSANISTTITVEASVNRDGLSDSATDTQSILILADIL